MSYKLNKIMMFLLLASLSVNAQDAKDLLTQIKTNLGKSEQMLRSYEWLETTVVVLDGKEKSTQVKRCYYGVDGKLYKTPVGAEKADAGPRGIRGKIVEKKKEEMVDYAEACVQKVHEYLPPKADKLQSLYAGGKLSVQAIEPNKRFNCNFSDYLQQGDMLGIGLNKEKQMLTGVSVKSYLDKPEDAVSFVLNYGVLPDGAQYPQETTLDMPAKKLKVIIRNEGYKKDSAK